MSKFITILLLAVVSAAAVAGGRWYLYVSSAKSPYDEVGIALNGYMPEPVRAWGCAKLQARFSNMLPPYGCQKTGGTGKEWLS